MIINNNEKCHVLMGLQLWQRKLKRKARKNDHPKNGCPMSKDKRAELSRDIQAIDTLRMKLKSN